jgi:hypothetical protein
MLRYCPVSVHLAVFAVDLAVDGMTAEISEIMAAQSTVFVPHINEADRSRPTSALVADCRNSDAHLIKIGHR